MIDQTGLRHLEQFAYKPFLEYAASSLRPRSPGEFADPYFVEHDLQFPLLEHLRENMQEITKQSSRMKGIWDELQTHPTWVELIQPSLRFAKALLPRQFWRETQRITVFDESLHVRIVQTQGGASNPFASTRLSQQRRVIPNPGFTCCKTSRDETNLHLLELFSGKHSFEALESFFRFRQLVFPRCCFASQHDRILMTPLHGV